MKRCDEWNGCRCRLVKEYGDINVRMEGHSRRRAHAFIYYIIIKKFNKETALCWAAMTFSLQHRHIPQWAARGAKAYPTMSSGATLILSIVDLASWDAELKEASMPIVTLVVNNLTRRVETIIIRSLSEIWIRVTSALHCPQQQQPAAGCCWFLVHCVNACTPLLDMSCLYRPNIRKCAVIKGWKEEPLQSQLNWQPMFK